MVTVTTHCGMCLSFIQYTHITSAYNYNYQKLSILAHYDHLKGLLSL